MTPLLTSSIPRHRGGRGDGAASARRHQARPHGGVGLRARRSSPGVAATPGFPRTRRRGVPLRPAALFTVGALAGAALALAAHALAGVIA